MRSSLGVQATCSSSSTMRIAPFPGANVCSPYRRCRSPSLVGRATAARPCTVRYSASASAPPIGWRGRLGPGLPVTDSELGSPFSTFNPTAIMLRTIHPSSSLPRCPCQSAMPLTSASPATAAVRRAPRSAASATRPSWRAWLRSGSSRRSAGITTPGGITPAHGRRRTRRRADRGGGTAQNVAIRHTFEWGTVR